MCNCDDDNGRAVRPKLNASDFTMPTPFPLNSCPREVFVKRRCEATEFVLPITYTELNPHSPLLDDISKMIERLVNEQPELMLGLIEGRLHIEVDPADVNTLRFVPEEKED